MSIDQETDTISIQSRDECFICMEETDQPVLNILDYDINRSCQCKGNLHALCYARWLRENKACPICRAPYVEQRVMTLRDFEIDMLPNNYAFHIVRVGHPHPRFRRSMVLSLIILLFFCLFFTLFFTFF